MLPWAAAVSVLSDMVVAVAVECTDDRWLLASLVVVKNVAIDDRRRLLKLSRMPTPPPRPLPPAEAAAAAAAAAAAPPTPPAPGRARRPAHGSAASCDTTSSTGRGTGSACGTAATHTARPGTARQRRQRRWRRRRGHRRQRRRPVPLAQLYNMPQPALPRRDVLAALAVGPDERKHRRIQRQQPDKVWQRPQADDLGLGRR